MKEHFTAEHAESAEKSLEPAKGPRVVEIDRWEVSRLLRRVLRERHTFRRVTVLVEDLEGRGRCYSSMTAGDRLWWYEAHKRKMLGGDLTD